MSKLNWEKQNKAEAPKEKRRVSNRSKVIKAYENGTKRERERIVKLLEPLAEHEDYCKDGCYLDDCVAWNYEFAIALIKGEQNV